MLIHELSWPIQMENLYSDLDLLSDVSEGSSINPGYPCIPVLDETCHCRIRQHFGAVQHGCVSDYDGATGVPEYATSCIHYSYIYVE